MVHIVPHVQIDRIAPQPWKPTYRVNHWSKLHIDWPLLIGLIALSCVGLLILYSSKQDPILLQKQALRLFISFGILFCVAQIPPRIFKGWAPWLYFTGLILLIAVLFVGDTAKGGQRWLNLGLIRFQPAELMKLAVPLMIARYFDDRLLPPTLSLLIIPTLIIVVPFLMVALQPDLGTAILIASAGILVLFFTGVSWKIILTLLTAALGCAPVMWLMLREYQRERVLTFLNPERDPLGSGYQIIQSKIAIGSGGIYGKGWLNGTQSHLEFLPERSTDSIFAVFGEEFGLIGILILLSLYMFVIVRGLYIGVQAQNTFSRLLAGSLVMTLFIYVFVNIGMVCGILPVVGIPLPLVSYGGTSMVTLMLSFGILMSIHTHRTLLRK